MGSYTPPGEAMEKFKTVLLDCGMKPQSESIAVLEAAGRLTAAPVYAAICAPHYNASAMDGIATCAAYTNGASVDSPVILKKGQFEQVDTGDLLPEGFDCVVMIEDVEFKQQICDAGEAVSSSEIFAGADADFRGANSFLCVIKAPSTPWKHVRVIGEDICAGEMILTSKSEITPSALGAMIAGGVTKVTVIKKPVVGFIPTGDEIISPVSNPKAGEILEFNSAIVSAMLLKRGAVPKIYPIVKDDKELIKKALKKAVKECDIVLLGAGASKGREDFSATAIEEVGKIVVQGIAMRPGKPTILGHSGKIPVIGMPGYPVSGIIVMEQIVEPLLSCLSHKERPHDKYIEATLSRPVKSTPGFFEFTRVKLGYVGERCIASPISGGSGVVTSIMRADGILEVPQDVSGYKSGDTVSVRLLRSEDELRRSIVVIGSHDPLIDEIADLLKHGDTGGDMGTVLMSPPMSPPVSINSTNTGSMAGIYAVRKGEAHIAGIHLLDEKTGEYNKTFVEKLIPEGSVTLKRLVKRKQGFLLARGNPKGITCVSDLTKPGVSYANRQKGSGTRILFDYLCQKDNVDTSKIYGYDREVYTHMSVAALVAAGMADAGIGVYSAAKMYDLDFLHICDEDYDLLIADHALALASVKALLEVIESDEFKTRLDALGGYIL